MDSKETSPKTFADFDQFGFEGFATRLTSFIETERRFVGEALLISLNGKFGSGKSTFFEMWREQLLIAESQRFSVITLNAWDADFERDALLAVIASFVDHFDAEGKKTHSEGLKKLGGKLAKFGFSVVNQIVKKQVGVDFQKAQKDAEPHKPGVLEKACFQNYLDRQKAFTELKELLGNAISEDDLPIIVIVDELDRCRPDYAVEYLETIKHIFDLKGLIFVLGVDKASLASSVRALFGESLDFDEYYRKFVHRNVNLPNLQGVSSSESDILSHLQSFVISLIRQYLESEDLISSGRHCFAKWEHHDVKKCSQIFLHLGLSPRQIHEVFRILAHVLSVDSNSNSNMLWGWQLGTIFLASLSVSRSSLYHNIGQGRVECGDIVSFFKNSPIMMESERHGFWWVSLVLLGAMQYSKDTPKDLTQILKGLNLWSEDYDDENLKRKIGEMSRAYDFFGYEETPPYRKIYEKIEAVKTFGN